MVCYLLMDESGDLGFDLNKKGASTFFLITFLYTENKRVIEKCVRRAHSSLRKKYRRVGTLHAYNDEAVTKKRLLSDLASKDIKIMTVYLDKRKVFTKKDDEKHIIYNYLTNILLDRIINKEIFRKDDSIEIIASRKDTSRVLNEKFKTYLINQISESHNANITVSIKTPSQEHGLQAVDYISWSIFRKYELQDEEYYRIIKEIIIEENSIMP